MIIDRRVANIGQARLKGLDLSVNYLTDLGFGELRVGVSANKQLSFDFTENANTVDQLEFDVPDFRLSANVGLSTGGFRSRVTLNYVNGFDTNIAVNQTEVDSFTLVDLFLGYEFPEGSRITEGLTIRLNIDSLFNTDPPVYRQQRNLNYSGFTLGRIVKLGVTKRF